MSGDEFATASMETGSPAGGDTGSAPGGNAQADGKGQEPENLLGEKQAENTPENLLADKGDANQTKPAEGADGAGKDAPKAYDLKYPDGMPWNDAQLDAYKKQAGQLGLTQEQAQKLLENAHANIAEQAKEHAAQVKRWAEEVRADKEIGGAAFESTIMHAKAGLKHFDQDGAIYKMLEETGHANHPAVIKFLSRIGKAHAEDSVPSGTSAGSEKPLEERLYGTQTNKKE